MWHIGDTQVVTISCRYLHVADQDALNRLHFETNHSNCLQALSQKQLYPYIRELTWPVC